MECIESSQVLVRKEQPGKPSQHHAIDMLVVCPFKREGRGPNGSPFTINNFRQFLFSRNVFSAGPPATQRSRTLGPRSLCCHATWICDTVRLNGIHLPLPHLWRRDFVCEHHSKPIEFVLKIREIRVLPHVDTRVFRRNNSLDYGWMSSCSASVSPPCGHTSTPFKATEDHQQINFFA